MTAGRINQVITALQHAPIAPSIKKDMAHLAAGYWNGVGRRLYVCGARVVVVRVLWGSAWPAITWADGVWKGRGGKSAATALVCPRSTMPQEHLQEADASLQVYHHTAHPHLHISAHCTILCECQLARGSNDHSLQHRP